MAAVNIAAAAVIGLVAYQPPTLNVGDTISVVTPAPAPNQTQTIALDPAAPAPNPPAK